MDKPQTAGWEGKEDKRPIFLADMKESKTKKMKKKMCFEVKISDKMRFYFYFHFC